MTDAAAGTDSTGTAGATPYRREWGGEVLLNIYSDLFDAMLLMERVSACYDEGRPVPGDAIEEIEMLSAQLAGAAAAANYKLEMPPEDPGDEWGEHWQFPEEERIEKRERLKQALRDRGLTNEAAGETIGVSGHTVGNWLRGGAIDGRRAHALFRLLGRDDYFGALYGEGFFGVMQRLDSHLDKLREARGLLGRMSTEEVDAILTIARSMTSHRTDT